MLELVKMCFIVNIVILALLLVCITFIFISYLKREKKHKEEKLELQKSRDYHIKELKKRSGVEDADIH